MSGVSRETEDKLARYAGLVRRWNSSINLVSRGTLDNFQERHIQDSLQLVDLTDAPSHWVDLGSGGGLPGIAVAAALQAQQTRFTLVESDRRKAVFLRTAVREMQLERVEILAQRIEQAPPQHADLVSARALAPLASLLGWVARHMRPDGVALLPKGREWQAEIDLARHHWQFHSEVFPSRTDPEAVVLKISGVSHA
jgi:16S rRNA (guanine527-N7)-methyltransferase